MKPRIHNRFLPVSILFVGLAASGFASTTTNEFWNVGGTGGSGALTKTTGCTLVLSGANTYTGLTTVSGGMLEVTGNGTLGTTAAGTVVSSGATLLLNGRNDPTGEALVINGTDVYGDGALTKTTGGTLVLSGANTYTGLTTVSGGTLEVTGNGTLGATAAGTTVSSGATLLLNGLNNPTGEALVINGTGSVNLIVAPPSGNLTISGGGTLTFTGGTSTCTEQVTAATNATINSGGVVTFTGGLVKDGTVLTITGGGTINVNTVGISGSLANSDLIVDGVTVNENVANTYNGPTYIRSTAVAGTGILNANVVDALPTLNGRSAVIMDDSGLGGSRLNLAASQAIASLTGAATSTINLNANTLTVGTTGGTTTFAGVISDSGLGGNLIKDGTSTQILSGHSTYGGSTAILDGTLQLGINNALPVTTSLTINPADESTVGVLNLAGFNQALAANGSGNALIIVAPFPNLTAVTGAGTLTLNGNVAVVDNTANPGNGFTTTIAAGTLDLGGAVRTFAVAGQNWGFSIPDLTVSSVIQNGGVIVNATNSTFSNSEA